MRASLLFVPLLLLALTPTLRAGPRFDVDFGYHLDSIEHLFFREAQRELASVGADGTVRLWNLGVNPPHCRATIHLPAVPNFSTEDPSGRFLACGYFSRGEVSILDLNDPGPAMKTISLPLNSEGKKTNFCPRFASQARADLSTTLMVGSDDGGFYRFRERDWSKVPKKMEAFVVPELKGYTPAAISLNPSENRLAVYAASRDGKAQGIFGIVELKSPPIWHEIKFEGISNLVVHGNPAMQWNRTGLAVVFASPRGEKDEAHVAIIPERAEARFEPIRYRFPIPDRFPTSVVWRDEQSLLISLNSDTQGNERIAPLFLDYDVEKKRLTDTPPSRIPNGFLTLQRELFREGLMRVAVFPGDPNRFALGHAMNGRIQYLTRESSFELGPQRNPLWYTRLDWDAKTEAIILTSPPGVNFPPQRFLLSENTEIARLTGLNRVGKLLPRKHPVSTGGVDAVLCKSQSPSGDQESIQGTNLKLIANGSRTIDESIGYTSLLTFENSNLIVGLAMDGSLRFWEFVAAKNDKPASFELLARAYPQNGRLFYVTPGGGRLELDPRGGQRMKFEQVPPEAEDQPIRRTLGVTDFELRGQPRILGFNEGNPLFSGPYVFDVETYSAGKFRVRMANRTIYESPELAAGTHPASVKLPKGEFDLFVDFLPTTQAEGGNWITNRRTVQVIDPKRILVIALVPQKQQFCVETPPDAIKNRGEGEPKWVAPGIPTAKKFCQLLERLGRDKQVDLAHVRTGEEMDTFLTALDQGVKFNGVQYPKPKEYDSIFVFLRGHTINRKPEGIGEYVFRTDGFVEGNSKTWVTGTTLKSWSDRIRGYRDFTGSVSMILDTCHAGLLKQAAQFEGVPCISMSIADETLEKLFPQVLDRALSEKPSAFQRRFGSQVTTEQFLHTLTILGAEVIEKTSDPRENKLDRPTPPFFSPCFYGGRTSPLGWSP